MKTEVRKKQKKSQTFALKGNVTQRLGHGLHLTPPPKQSLFIHSRYMIEDLKFFNEVQSSKESKTHPNSNGKRSQVLKSVM